LLVAKHKPGLEKPRQYFTVNALMGAPQFGVINNDYHSTYRAIMERVFFVKEGVEYKFPPRPKEKAFAKCKEFFRRVVAKCAKTAPVDEETVVSYYEGRKRLCYERARVSLDLARISKYSEVPAFVKFEKYNYTLKPDPVPRLIQPRDPRFNLLLGKYLKPIEHNIYRAINQVFNTSFKRWSGPRSRTKTVMKGLNPKQRGALLAKKWATFKDPVALSCDVSRFDQHVSRDAIRFEHRFYRALYQRTGNPCPRELSELLTHQLYNVCHAAVPDGYIQYYPIGNRMSGDLNTGLGNVILMCAMLYTYLASLGIHFELADDGDDCVIMIERKDLALVTGSITSWFRDMGFTLVVDDYVDEFEKIKFCQCSPVCVPGGWLMVRSPHDVMSKDATILQDVSDPALFKAYCHDLGACGAACNPGVPILEEYYRVFQRHGDGKGGVMNMARMSNAYFYNLKGMEQQSDPISDEARATFHFAFGIPPDVQIEVENHLRQVVLDDRTTSGAAANVPWGVSPFAL